MNAEAHKINTKAYTAKHSMHCQSPHSTAKQWRRTVKKKNIHPNDFSFVAVSFCSSLDLKSIVVTF